MKHITSKRFWKYYEDLPDDIQSKADKNFSLLKENPWHPSLHFKKVRNYWSARVGRNYRALAFEVPGGFMWFWIGPHSAYDKILNH